MFSTKTLINQEKSSDRQEPRNKQRRTFFGGAAATLLASSGRVKADQNNQQPNNPFILLLHGLYQPVASVPGNLGLNPSTVNLSDGSYSRTKIYPVYGVPNIENEDQQDDGAIGNFFVSLATGLCAYQLPGGALAMSFNSGPVIASVAFNTFFSPAPLDGKGGQYNEGTFELTILEATGVYSAFKGGHNHMVDRLHQLVAGPFFAGFPSSGYNEFCFCNISQYQFP